MRTAKNFVVASIILLSATMLLTAFSTGSFKTPAATLNGAWGYGTPGNRTVMIFSGNVFSVASYDIPGKKMISSYGGTWKVEGNKLLRKIEWNSIDSTQVGNEWSHAMQMTNTRLNTSQSNEKWERLDDGGPGELAGVWVITGNYTNDKVSKRASPFYPRRTMKVLSGKYFHWIAYNAATKQFLNAGGGAYTTANGKYTENIEFFTKTAESVGKSLVFDYSFVDGDWRHRGQKSTGGAMDECWTKRELLEK
ncbi:MAG: membrane or secreted protein [Bacteroidota bacterium]